MSGSIMPTPLAIPTTRRRAAADRRRSATFGNGVGRHDALGGRVAPRCRSAPRGVAAIPARTRPSGIGGRSPRSRRPGARPGHSRAGRRRRRASSTASCVAGGAVRDVGVLRHDHDRPGPPVGEVLAADRHARAGEPALREHAGGGYAAASAAMTTKSSVSSLMPMLATWHGTRRATGSCRHHAALRRPPDRSGHGIDADTHQFGDQFGACGCVTGRGRRGSW